MNIKDSRYCTNHKNYHHSSYIAKYLRWEALKEINLNEYLDYLGKAYEIMILLFATLK